MRHSSSLLHNTALFEHSEDVAVGEAAEEYSGPDICVVFHNLEKDLCPRTVYARDTVYVENDVFIMFWGTHSGQRWVHAARTIQFQSAETVPEVAGIGESERLRYLDDQGSFDRFDVLGVKFGIIESTSPRYFSQDLNTRLCGVSNQDEDRKPDAQRNAQLQGIENRRSEDEDHQSQL